MSDTTTDTGSRRVTGRKTRHGISDFFIRLVKEKPMGTVGAVIVLALLFLSLIHI